MRSRPIRVSVQLSEDENKKFLCFVKKSGLKKSVYLRHLINGLQPRESPSEKYYKIMEDLYSINNQLNNSFLCQKEDLQEINLKIEWVILEMTSLFVSPEKMRNS